MTNRELIWDKSNQIIKLKAELRRTDYMAIKFAEGELTAEEYAEVKEQRRAWRAEINRLQAEVEVLMAELSTLLLKY